MSDDLWIGLLTPEEYEAAQAKVIPHENNFWHDNCDNNFVYCFGDLQCSDRVFWEIEALKPKVDDVVALLEFLFLQSSESQQIDMFSRFLAANLGKGKIVHFWSE